MTMSTTTVPEWRKRLWTFLVNLIANLIADVLEHPRVQKATSKFIVKGINDTLDQSDFPTKIKVLSLLAMDETQQVAVSRQLGEQFPKAAVNFLGGAVAGLRGKSKSSSKLLETKQGTNKSSSKKQNDGRDDDDGDDETKKDA
jgi:hypothetical protein